LPEHITKFYMRRKAPHRTAGRFHFLVHGEQHCYSFVFGELQAANLNVVAIPARR